MRALLLTVARGVAVVCVGLLTLYLQAHHDDLPTDALLPVGVVLGALLVWPSERQVGPSDLSPNLRNRLIAKVERGPGVITNTPLLEGVVSLDEHRPHVTGDAACGGCGHAWVAAVDARADLSSLECPACRGPWGHMEPPP